MQLGSGTQKHSRGEAVVGRLRGKRGLEKLACWKLLGCGRRAAGLAGRECGGLRAAGRQEVSDLEGPLRCSCSRLLPMAPAGSWPRLILRIFKLEQMCRPQQTIATCSPSNHLPDAYIIVHNCKFLCKPYSNFSNLWRFGSYKEMRPSKSTICCLAWCHAVRVHATGLCSTTSITSQLRDSSRMTGQMETFAAVQ